MDRGPDKVIARLTPGLLLVVEDTGNILLRTSWPRTDVPDVVALSAALTEALSYRDSRALLGAAEADRMFPGEYVPSNCDEDPRAALQAVRAYALTMPGATARRYLMRLVEGRPLHDRPMS